MSREEPVTMLWYALSSLSCPKLVHSGAAYLSPKSTPHTPDTFPCGQAVHWLTLAADRSSPNAGALCDAQGWLPEASMWA